VYARLHCVVVALALVGVSGGCRGSEAASQVNMKGSVLLADELRGTFVGVALGDSRAEVRRRLGSAACRDDGLITPVGTDPMDVGGLYVGEYRPRKPDGPYKGCVMRYRGVVFVVDIPDGVVSMGTTDPRAQTRRGVRIGDSADVVRQRYPGAECQGRETAGFWFWEEEAVPGGCRLPTVTDKDSSELTRLHFGLDQDGERVTSIWLDAPSWQAIQRLRRR